MLESSRKLSFPVIFESYKTKENFKNYKKIDQKKQNKSKLRLTYFWSNRGRTVSIS